jgi:hypothetical protein
MALNATYVPVTHLEGKFLQKFMGPQMVTDNGGPNIGRVHNEHREHQCSKESLDMA